MSKTKTNTEVIRVDKALAKKIKALKRKFKKKAEKTIIKYYAKKNVKK